MKSGRAGFSNLFKPAILATAIAAFFFCPSPANGQVTESEVSSPSETGHVAVRPIYDRCPPLDRKPAVTRKSIVMKDGHFGEGTLEAFNELAILHLYGSPFEMGHQHGAMLKEEIRQRLIRERTRRGLGKTAYMMEMTRAVAQYQSIWPGWAREELKGMSEGSGVGIDELAWLNAIYDDFEVGASKPPTDGGPENEDAAWASSIESGEEDSKFKAPNWVLIFYHQSDSHKVAAITLPGRVGSVASMNARGCVGYPGKSKSDSLLAIREVSRTGLCEKHDKPETLEISLAGNEGLSLVFDPVELVIFMKPGNSATWTASDMETESFRPDCDPPLSTESSRGGG